MILSVRFFSLDLLMPLFIYVATQNGGCVNSVFTQFDMPNSFYQIMSWIVTFVEQKATIWIWSD